MNHIQNPKTKYGSATNSFNNFKSANPNQGVSSATILKN